MQEHFWLEIQLFGKITTHEYSLVEFGAFKCSSF